MRAILKANDLCARAPERVAHLYVERGWVKPAQREFVVQATRALPFPRWRSYDAADTVRFHALPLREAGRIKSAPQRILAEGTNWRLLDDLKKELKG